MLLLLLVFFVKRLRAVLLFLSWKVLGGRSDRWPGLGFVNHCRDLAFVPGELEGHWNILAKG